jgi:hypothetical protein
VRQKIAIKKLCELADFACKNPRALDNRNMKTFALAFFQRTGKKGGSSTSKAKADAARINGRKGGRPKKVKS